MSPQFALKSAFEVTLGVFVKKKIWESSSCLYKCIHSNSLVVCFDLLGPKFLMRAGRLKKGAGGLTCTHSPMRWTSTSGTSATIVEAQLVVAMD